MQMMFRAGLMFSLWCCLVPVRAETDASVQDADASCTPFNGMREKIADAGDTRIKTTLFRGLEGKRIRQIGFKTISVFDPEDPRDSHQLYLWLNKLHINTRPSVIRAQLLFEEGGPLKVEEIEESERILRSRSYLTNAYIVPVTVCDDQVDLLVVTQDAWALEPQFSVSRESEDTKTGFAISDGNILGTGNSLTISYAESDKRNLVGYNLTNPHIFNSQISTRLYYADTTDGRNSMVKIEKPFHALATPWAAGMHVEELALTNDIRYRDEQINEYQHFSRFNQVYAGLASDVNSHYTQRWLVGFSQEEDEFAATAETTMGIPQDRNATYSWVEYQYLDNRFGVFKNVNQIQRAEDISLGKTLSLRLGYGPSDWDNPGEVLRYIASYTQMIDIQDLHLFELGFSVNGRQYAELDDVSSQVLSSTISYNYFHDEKNRWYFSVNYSQGNKLAQFEELTVGDITGLRGYPTDFQRGNRRYVFTAERRYFSDLHLFSLLRVGAVAFFDMGKAWGLPEYGESQLLSNVGIGLRLSSSRVKIGTVARLDIATPLVQRNGISEYQVTIGGATKF